MEKLTQKMKDCIIARLYEWDYQMHCFDNDEEDKFMEWFLENAYSFKTSSILNESIINDSKVIANRCFGNSQYIANKYNSEYVEGFILYEDSYIPHGFNLCSDRVNDFTLTKVSSVNKLPKEYYGIIIPIDFIIKKQREDIDLPSINTPLIIEYFREQQSIIKKEDLAEGISVVKYKDIPVVVTTIYKNDCLVKDNNGNLYTARFEELIQIQ